MSQRMMLMSSVDVICPYCGEYVEVWDVDIAMTIEGVDVGRVVNESEFYTICGVCGEDFVMEAVGEIKVRKI